jgi:hypothetical protein
LLACCSSQTRRHRSTVGLGRPVASALFKTVSQVRSQELNSAAHGSTFCPWSTQRTPRGRHALAISSVSPCLLLLHPLVPASVPQCVICFLAITLPAFNVSTILRTVCWSQSHKSHAPDTNRAMQPLHCTALHYTALHCTALHYTALHCTALHCIVLHCTALRVTGYNGQNDCYAYTAGFRCIRGGQQCNNHNFISDWTMYVAPSAICKQLICSTLLYSVLLVVYVTPSTICKQLLCSTLSRTVLLSCTLPPPPFVNNYSVLLCHALFYSRVRYPLHHL